MEPLIIKGQIDTPDVFFDSETNLLSISGISHPENAKEFYKKIQDWLDDYFEFIRYNKPQKIVVDLNYRYLNSSSYKYLKDVLSKISNYANNHIAVEVIWNYFEDDEDMLNEGIVLCELPDVKLPYRCVPYN